LNQRLLWLSHVLEPDTPSYGGGEGFTVSPVKALAQGDSCNTSILSFPNHIGSHVDAPRHFLSNGSTIDAYAPKDWIFTHPLMVDIPAKPGQLIGPEVFPSQDCASETVDLLLIRTGFEAYRDCDVYWQEGPGLLPELADYFRNHFPSLKAVGLDTISISGFQHRDIGRKAHAAFLSNDVRIFEDLSLMSIHGSRSLSQVAALPLRFYNADGSPCTILGWEQK